MTSTLQQEASRKFGFGAQQTMRAAPIGGFLMTEAGRVLKPGEVVQYNGLLFKVERVEKRRVMRVKLEIIQTNGEGELTNEPDRARSGA
jgi:CBS domain containing-hemolysin-like protein